MTFPLTDLIDCAERELRVRRRVYANRVLTHRMSRAFADRQIALMQAIVDNLKSQTKGAENGNTDTDQRQWWNPSA